MAHYAQLDENNVVTQVIVVGNENAPTEEAGQEFIASIGLTGTWLQTSYNTYGGEHLLDGLPLRKNYAGIGFTYDEVRDAFIPPIIYPSWVLNEETCHWEPPTPYPNDGGTYQWVEDDLNWQLIEGV